MPYAGRRRWEPVMGTIVTVDVPPYAAAAAGIETCDAAIERALHWFRVVEQACSRFDPDSELCALSRRVGDAVAVSSLLFEAVRFALTLAEETDGAFDPAVGRRMERLGFNVEHRTGRHISTPSDIDTNASWRDVRLDSSNSTVTIERPLVLDLGAVAKGLAVDLATRELRAIGDFGVDAGGDLYLGGHRAADAPWSVGIRHPLRDDVQLESLRVSNRAVCTSGNYEKQRERGTASRHLVDARTGATPGDLLSVTVVATSAMLADAMATAAFVLGADRGRQLLETHGLPGLLFTSTADRITTKEWSGDGAFL